GTESREAPEGPLLPDGGDGAPEALRDRGDRVPGRGRELHRHRARGQGRVAAGLPQDVLRGRRAAQREVRDLDAAARLRRALREDPAADQRAPQDLQGHGADGRRRESPEGLRTMVAVAEIHENEITRTANQYPVLSTQAEGSP